MYVVLRLSAFVSLHGLQPRSLSFLPAFHDRSLHFVVTSVVQALHHFHQRSGRVCLVAGLRRLLLVLLSLLLVCNLLAGLEIAPSFKNVGFSQADGHTVRLHDDFTFAHWYQVLKLRDHKSQVLSLEALDLEVKALILKVTLYVSLFKLANAVESTSEVNFDPLSILGVLPGILRNCGKSKGIELDVVPRSFLLLLFQCSFRFFRELLGFQGGYSFLELIDFSVQDLLGVFSSCSR